MTRSISFMNAPRGGVRPLSLTLIPSFAVIAIMIAPCLQRSKRSERRFTSVFYATLVGFAAHSNETMLSMAEPVQYQGFPNMDRREATIAKSRSNQAAIFATKQFPFNYF